MRKALLLHVTTREGVSMASKASDVKALSLAEQGHGPMAWALQERPVIRSLMVRFQKERPLESVSLTLTGAQRSYLASWQEGS